MMARRKHCRCYEGSRAVKVAVFGTGAIGGYIGPIAALTAASRAACVAVFAPLETCACDDARVDEVATVKRVTRVDVLYEMIAARKTFSPRY